MTVTSDDLAELLAPMAAGLAADGYRLDATMEAAVVDVRISATETACEDCLVPRDVLRGIVAETLRRQGVAGVEVVVHYPADA